MEWLTDPNAWIGLLTLTALEIVLGIDNIIFISILSSQLPTADQARARKMGLTGAFGTRVLLLLSIAWIVKLTTPLFSAMGVEITGRGLILLVGGLFLIAKATFEIHGKLEGEEHESSAKRAGRSLAAVVAQIMVIDIVFSLDSVITAVGMVSQVSIMIAANVVALGLMLLAATSISDFVDRHPTIKVLGAPVRSAPTWWRKARPPHRRATCDVLLVRGGDAEPSYAPQEPVVRLHDTRGWRLREPG